MPRKGCFGDMDGLPGVRNYGTMENDELYDVYCYVENIHGKQLAPNVTLSKQYCRLYSKLGLNICITSYSENAGRIMIVIVSFYKARKVCSFIDVTVFRGGFSWLDPTALQLVRGKGIL